MRDIMYARVVFIRPMSHLRFYRTILLHECATESCDKMADDATVELHAATLWHKQGPLSKTTRVRRYQKGKTNLDFTEARDSQWQWHQLGCMQVCTLLQTDNHDSTSPLSSLQAGCPSCCPTNSVRAVKKLNTNM